MTSQVRAWPPATGSSDKPKEDVWIRRLDHKKGWQHRKGTTINVNLRSRSRVTKRHFWPKGWPHPEGRHRRSKQLKPPHRPGPEKRNPARRRRTKPARRRDSLRDYRSPKNTAPAWGRGPHTKARNQTHHKEGKSSLRLRTEEEHSPDLRQVTPSRRPWTPQDWGSQRHRSPTRASRHAPDRKPG